MTTTKNIQTTGTALAVVQAEAFSDALMTREEAEAHTECILRTANGLRWLLLEAFERKVYKALGYSSFEDYARERLGQLYAADVLSRMVRWAATERNVMQLPKTWHNGNFNETHLHRPKLTWAVAKQLSKLPTAQLQLDAFEQIEALKEHGARTPGEYQTGLKRIVARMLRGENAAILDTPQTPVAPPKPTSFEQAVQERVPSAPAKVPPAVKPSAPTSSKPSVSGFTPPADEPFDEEPVVSVKEEFDLDAIIDALETAMRWLEAGRVEGNRKEALIVSARLMEGVRWIEQQMC